MTKGPTNNALNHEFVFINKNAKSSSLSRSHGAEKTSIYGHVRRHMVRDNLEIKQEFNQVFGDSSGKRPATADKVIHLQQQLGVPNGISASPYSRSYHYFRQMTISEAAGFADSQFWDAALQLSTFDEAIFHALSALGALHESLMSADEASRREHHTASLVHCNRAIRIGLRQVPLPLMLVVCVIITTIQLFADAPQAQKTLESGIRLVHDAQKASSRLSGSQQSLVDLVSKMFDRYQSRITLILLPTTVAREHFNPFMPQNKVPRVPAIFPSLLQARAVLQAICDWSFHVVKNKITLQLTDRLQREWSAALGRLAENAHLHPLSLRSLNLLKVARLASACLIAAQFATQQPDFDDYFPSFKQIVSMYYDSFNLCNSSTLYRTIFEFDAGIIDVLTHVGRECPDLELREQALQALKITNPVGTLAFDQNVVTAPPAEHPGLQSQHLRIKSLDFFAQTGLARLRLSKAAIWETTKTDIVERWFSMLDVSPEPRYLDPADIPRDAPFKGLDVDNR